VELSRWGERALDVRLILDSIQPIETILGPTRRVDATRVGIGGHSLGAQTAQLIGGVRPGRATSYAGQDLRDNRADAILVLSGQGAGREFDEQSWAGAVLPTLVITGTNDESASTGQDSNWRREPFDRAPPGGKHLLFIKDAYHGFGGISGARLPGPNAGPSNEAHVRIVQTATLRFWDAYLKNQPAARQFFSQAQAGAFQEQATLTTK
jgi:predicted dienelactone hydrolase